MAQIERKHLSLDLQKTLERADELWDLIEEHDIFPKAAAVFMDNMQSTHNQDRLVYDYGFEEEAHAASTETFEGIAKICHNANKAFCEYLGDNSQVDWEIASQEQKSSAINGVVLALARDLTPEQMHSEWKEFKVKQGWTYGPIKSEKDKVHPCIVPYDQLPQEQKFKDILFLAIVNSMK